MNFFGHAAVATWTRDEPGFVFGAMLPDFATMIGARPPRADDPEITDGIALHHRTDDAFHGSEVFRALQSDALRSLGSLGVRRGPARAVAHVGVEILLDGVLAGDASHREGYVRAVRHAGTVGVEEAIAWEHGEERARFAELRDRLERFGVRTDATANEVAERLHRILTGRRLLALASRELDAVATWVERARPLVRESAPRLVAELRRRLAP